MHFGGFVISDYEGINHITGGPADPARRDSRSPPASTPAST